MQICKLRRPAHLQIGLRFSFIDRNGLGHILGCQVFLISVGLNNNLFLGNCKLHSCPYPMFGLVLQVPAKLLSEIPVHFAPQLFHLHNRTYDFVCISKIKLDTLYKPSVGGGLLMAVLNCLFCSHLYQSACI